MNDAPPGRRQEGQLQTIGIPPEWADYADILAGYTKHYSVPISYKVEAEYSSAQELVVFKDSKSHPHGDIGDVGFKFGPTAIQQGLVTPYIHSHWSDIDAGLKDPQGYWCTEYYGAQALVINTDIVKNPPASFADLLSNNYKNMVGIYGDPRQANDAFLAVFSASLAHGGSLDNIQPGIDFTALIGGVFGALAAYGVYNLRTGWLRNLLIGFSSIAANFAGVPLAFAFVATLGVTGFVTVVHNWFHLNLYDLGFSGPFTSFHVRVDEHTTLTADIPSQQARDYFVAQHVRLTFPPEACQVLPLDEQEVKLVQQAETETV